MWKTWFQLSEDQKLEACSLSGDVRKEPSHYYYYENSSGHVTDYRYIYP